MKTLTRNGIMFDLVAPTALDVDWDATAWSAAHINRWNGHADRPVSLAMHMYSVGLAARHILAGHVHSLAYLSKAEWTQALDMAQLLGHIHDCPETVTGDMTTPWRLSLAERVQAKLHAMGLSGQHVTLAGAVLKDEMEAPAIHAAFAEASGLTAALNALGPDVGLLVRQSVARADHCALHFEFKRFNSKAQTAHFDRFPLAFADNIPWDSSMFDATPAAQAELWLSRLRFLSIRAAEMCEPPSGVPKV